MSIRKISFIIFAIALCAIYLLQIQVLAADQDGLSAQQKYELLIKNGLFAGVDEDENVMELDDNMTRAQAAKVVAMLSNIDVDHEPTESMYSDVSIGSYAAAEILSLTKAGILQGHGNGLFGPDQKLTIEQLAKIAVDLMDYEPEENTEIEHAQGASEWAKEYVAIALSLGLIPEARDYSSEATREILVGAAYAVQQQFVKETESERDEHTEDSNATLFLSPIPSLTSNAGATIHIPLEVTGSFSEPITFTQQGLPPGSGVINSGSSPQIIGTPYAEGTYNITITATDQDGFASSQTFTWTVNEWIVIYSPPPIVPATEIILPIVTLHSESPYEGGPIILSSNVQGILYIVHENILGTNEYNKHNITAEQLQTLASLSSLNILFMEVWEADIDQHRNFDVVDLKLSGTYYLYAVDLDDNVSLPIELVIDLD